MEKATQVKQAVRDAIVAWTTRLLGEHDASMEEISAAAARIDTEVMPPIDTSIRNWIGRP